MAENVLQGVIETVDEALLYRNQLQELQDSLTDAKKQVINTASQSRQKLIDHLNCLKSCVSEALDERFRLLDAQLNHIEKSSLEPLNACEVLLNERVDFAASVLKTGMALLQAEEQQPGSKNPDMISFKDKLKELDLTSLPAVPSLSEVACISVDLPRDEEDIKKRLREAIADYGRVLSRAPVQISDVLERPGALLIRWNEVSSCEDQLASMEEYLLECTAVNSPGTYRSVYRGPSLFFLCRQVQPNVPYRFRVSGRCECTQPWAPYSVPVIGITRMPKHAWGQCEVPSYSLSQDNSILETGDSPVVVYSQSKSYSSGQTLLFHIVRSGESDPSDGLGLSVDSSGSDILQNGYIFVSTEGIIYINGQEKTTRLPVMTSGVTVTFDTEQIRPNKVRLTIEIQERVVTFDWSTESADSVSLPGLQMTDNNSFFFLAKFSKPRWSVHVE